MQELLEYVQNLTITQGVHVGERFTVLPWEKRFLRGAFKPGISTAALTVGRGNGKTTLIGAIGAAAVNGPLAQPRAEVLVVASSFNQARIDFEHIKAFLLPAIDADPQAWRVQDSANYAQITYRPTGASIRAIASDPRRAHGRAPALVIADEPAQWTASTSEKMLSALQTSLGKIPNSRMIALGTRPADDDHWFSRWLKSADYSQVHAARDDDPPYQRRVWKKANPSLDHMPNLETAIRADSKRARGDDSELQAFRSLRLNQGVSDTVRAVVLETDTWRRCEVQHLPHPQGQYVWGVDLGTSAAMSAIAAYDPLSYRLEVVAAFPTIPSLAERGKKDAVATLYQRMYERGELVQTGGRAVDYVELVELAYLTWGEPLAVVCDSWRQADLIDALDSAGLTSVPVVPRRNGPKDGSEDMRRFRRAAIEGKIKTPESLLMRSAIAGAVTISDASGNHRLAKAEDTPARRDGHRDDALAAAILAVAEGVRNPPETKRTGGRYLGLV